MKKILYAIQGILATIAMNPSVYSAELVNDINELLDLIRSSDI
jgi:hypothetical protein